MEEPILSHRFDVDDIRKLRDYNSWRHSQMTSSEVIADIRKGAEEFLSELRQEGARVAEATAKYAAEK